MRPWKIDRKMVVDLSGTTDLKGIAKAVDAEVSSVRRILKAKKIVPRKTCLRCDKPVLMSGYESPRHNVCLECRKSEAVAYAEQMASLEVKPSVTPRAQGLRDPSRIERRAFAEAKDSTRLGALMPVFSSDSS